MIHWYRHLYMDGKVAKRPAFCKRSVEAGKIWKKNYFVLTLAVNQENLFEIMGTRQLFFRYYRNADLYVIGLAASRESAQELLLRIVEDVCCEDRDFSPRRYFLKQDFSG